MGIYREEGRLTVTGSPSTLPTVGLSAQSMPSPLTFATQAALSFAL